MKVTMKRVMIVLCLLLAGCASHRTTFFSQGNSLYTQGRYDEALLEYAKAVMEQPEKHEYRIRLYETKSKAALIHLQKGRALLASGDNEEAVAELIRASMLDPSLKGAGQELKEAQKRLQIEALYLEAEQLFSKRNLDQAQDRLEKILAVIPRTAGLWN